MDGCPDEETILDFVDGRLFGEVVTVIEEHADGCASCLEVIAGAADAPPPTQPARRGTGRTYAGYRLLDMIGHGGMGIVYRAVHVASGENVALKLVQLHAHGALASIRREIQALDRLRHPGVVRILEHGIEDGRPWYAMDLIEGSTLAEHITAIHAPGKTRSMAALPETLSTLRRLCGTLSFLHGRGAVHRDLKPQNVIVRPDGAPILVDFGLALRDEHPGRVLLASAALVGGTIYYMAPEQIRGELLDPRADLYALGCILYETVTGHPPFDGQTLMEIAWKHLSLEPEPPSARLPDLDPGLEKLILRLLQKRPRDRLGYAEDVAAALAPWSPAASPWACPAGQPYVYRPEFTGRVELLDELGELLRKAARGGGGARAFVGGESGVGKSRFLAEVAHRARNLELRVVIGECVTIGAHPTRDAEQATALSPLRPLLRALVDACSDSRVRADRLVGPRGRLLAAYEPALLRLPGQDAYPDPPPLAAQAAHERLLAALHETIARLAEDAPLLLILDDLQWADALSLDVLEKAPPGFFEGRRILLIGAYRSTEMTPRLERIADAPGARRATLGRFDDAAIAHMVGDMLALDEVPALLIARISAASDGNPFFVAEYLRAAVDEGWIVRELGGTWRFAASARPLPGSLRELLDLRLLALSAPARAMIEVASVLGRELEADLLVATAGLTETESVDALKELVARALFEELDRDRFRFAHEKLREAADDGLPADLRRVLHRRAALAIERRRSGAALGSYHPVLAHHWARAAIYGKAVDHLELAGEQTLASAAYAEAAGFFLRALDLEVILRDQKDPIDGERVARWQRRLGEAFCALGDLPRCEEHVTRALDGFGHPLPRSRAGWALELATQLGRQARHLAQPGRDVERSPAGRARLREAALAAARMSYRFYFAEDGLASVTSSLMAVNLAERAATEGLVALPYAQLGYLAGVCKLGSLAGAYFRRARQSAEAANDLQELVVALSHEALLHACDGQFAEAERLCRRALDRLGGASDSQANEGVWIILAHVDLCAGRPEASLRLGAALLASARARQHHQHQAFGLYAMARAQIRLGALDEACAQLVEARAVLEAMPKDPLSESVCAGLEALALAERGELEAAERRADAAMEAIGRAPSALLSLADGYDGAAEVYLALWRRARRAGGPVPASILTRADRAGAAMRRFAVLFPIGRPRYLLYLGRALALRGSARGAVIIFRRAGDTALALGMPHEAARATRFLGELEARTSGA
jgi:hypothetical protein